jgi:hypothetical protein
LTKSVIPIEKEMKKQLEDLFRESLGKHEMPYDPAAWKAMQKNLPSSSGNSFLKIAVASAASVALVICVEECNVAYR